MPVTTQPERCQYPYTGAEMMSLLLGAYLLGKGARTRNPKEDFPTLQAKMLAHAGQ